MNLYTSAHRLCDIIDEDAQILTVMSKFGISLGFADRSVAAVCRQQGVDEGTFLAVANFVSRGVADCRSVDLAALIGYLENAHSYFLEFCIPAIRRKLLEALACSSDGSELALVVLKFYDEYAAEVDAHMSYESRKVFTYVRSLLEGKRSRGFSIDDFAEHHHSIHHKLRELKGILIRFLPQRDNNLLNAALFDIINCERDLMSHCRVEDRIFVPAVRALEQRVSPAAADVDCEIADTADSSREGGAAGDSAEVSTRERDIISCVARGLSNKEIADELCISVNTVTTHRRNIVQKLNIHSAAGLAIYAVLNGIVKIEDLTPIQQ